MPREIYGDSPYERKKGRTSSKTSKAKRAEAVREAHARAAAKFAIVRYVREELAGLSLNQAYAAVADRIKNGDLPRVAPRGIPSKATFYRLLAVKPQSSERPLAATDFLDKPGRGRKRKTLEPRMAKFLEQEILAGAAPSAPALLRSAREFAQQENLPAPTLHDVQSFEARIPQDQIVAARHGAKAAVSDAMPHATVYTERPFDVVTLDEAKIPVFIKAVEPINGKLVSVETWLIAMVDNHSRVVPSYHVVPPYIGEAAAGYEDTDIVGAFLGMALRDLTPPAVRPYAGYLPRVLRMDNHPTHRGLRTLLARHAMRLEYVREAAEELRPSASAENATNSELGMDVEDGVPDGNADGVIVPRLPKEEPRHRGLVERLIGSIKDLCAGIPGHVDTCLPTDRIEREPGRMRAHAVGTKTRVTRKEVVRVEDLLDVDGLSEWIGRKLIEYHARPHRMLLGQTPDAVFRLKHDRRQAHHGADALLMLDPAILTVTKAGIEHRTRRGSVLFSPDSCGQVLEKGEQIKCLTEPLNRKLYGEVGGAIVCFTTQAEFARDNEPGAYTRRKAARAREASDYAAEVFDERRRARWGVEAVIAADEELERRLAEGKRERRRVAKANQARGRKRAAIKRERGELPPIRRPKAPDLSVSRGDPRATETAATTETTPETSADSSAGTSAERENGATDVASNPDPRQDEQKLVAVGQRPMAARPKRGMVRSFGGKTNVR